MGDFLENTLRVLRRAVEMGGFPEELYTVLSKPERVVVAAIPVRMDSGRLEVFEGFRVQHCSVLGPYKGGIRFHPSVTLEDDIALATLMTLKNSLAGLPYGGGKGAVRVDPRKLSKRELEELSRGYVRALYPILGKELDVPAPDVGTSPQVMAWMVDEYSRLAGENVPSVFTGKPAELWGDPTRVYATGFGCAVVTKLAADKVLGGLEGRRVSVQGFGNVGFWHAYWLQKMGAKVVAVSDSGGTLYDPAGIEVEEVMRVKSETGSVINYPRGQKLSDPRAALYVEADILAPDAMENQVTMENVGLVRAKVLIEGANGPVTPDAERVLYDKGGLVVPDFLANSGGVIASYLEWVQGVTWYWWGEEESRKRVEDILRRNFELVFSTFESLRSERGGSTMRDAAMIVALERLYRAFKARGRL